MGSDVVVIAIVLTLVFWETLGSSRQGFAYSLLQLLRGGHVYSAVDPAAPIVSTSTFSPSDGDPLKGVAVLMGTGTNAGIVSSGDAVAAFSDACPVYTKRWLTADAAIALGIALIQVPLIGML